MTALLVAAIVEMHAREQDTLNSSGNANGVEQAPYFINKAFTFFELVQKNGLDGRWKINAISSSNVKVAPINFNTASLQ